MPDNLRAPGTAACPACGNANRDGARFCDSCGAPLSGRADVPVPEHLVEKLRAAPTGERKQVTVLFADVSGSMDLAESVDAEEWRTIMDRFFAILCEGVHAQEGTVVQFTGDGIMALFGAPIAHEDHALRAARAALALNARVAEYAAELRRDQGLNFSTRMGLNSGEVVVGAIGADLRVDYTAIGHTVGLAQRMESLAEPGRIYVTEYTAALLEGFFKLDDLGRFEVKGTREPLGVSALAGVGQARTRFDVSRARGFSAFVGREHELAVLEGALERALAGHGSVVGIAGEAGLGKSRLCHEFAERVRAQGIPVFYASAAAHARHVPFHTALELLRSYFGVTDDDEPRVVRERVAGRLLLLDASFADELPLIFDFLGAPDPARPVGRLDPDARKRRLHALVERLVRVSGERELAVNLVEDLHWIDGGSEAFLNTLVESLPDQPALTVVNYRPEYSSDWMRHPWFEPLVLVPLGPAELERLLIELLGDAASLEHLRRSIAERTGGNPFFVEEVVRNLIEQGVVEGPRGARTLAAEPGTIAVPATVHAVLAARIDRLPATAKELLQVASVVGREFTAALAGRAAGLETAELDAGLHALVDSEFVAAGGDGTYQFLHPLTQEVAYGSLLSERRREVHAAVAAALEELHADTLDELAALLARHHDEAGDRLAAARWHARAAAWAGIHDPIHALAHWRAVRERCDALPEDPETIALGMVARIWILQLDWRVGAPEAEVEATFQEARALADRSGDEVAEAMLLATYGTLIGVGGRMHEGLRYAEEAIKRAERLGNQWLWLTVLPSVAYGRLVVGRIHEAVEILTAGIELTDADPNLAAQGLVIGSPRAWCRMLRSFLFGVIGRLDDAYREYEEGLRLARLDGDGETEGWVLMQYGQFAFYSGRLEGAVETAARGVALADAQGSAFSRIWTRYCLGHAFEATGDLAAAESTVRDAVALIEEYRTARECEPWSRSLLARCLAARGEVEAALREVERIRVLADERGVHNSGAILAFTHGRVLAAGGDLAGASAAYDAGDRASDELRIDCFRPLLWLARADLAVAARDPEGERAALEQAVAWSQRNGATGWAEVARERLAATAAAAP